MKRILIISQILPLKHHNGGSTQIRNLIIASRLRGYKIDFLSLKLPLADEPIYCEVEEFLKNNTEYYQIIPFEDPYGRPGRKGMLEYFSESLDRICAALSGNEYLAIFAEFTGMARYLRHFKRPVKFINIHELNILKELRELRLDYNLKDRLYLFVSAISILREELKLLKEADVILSYNEIEIEIIKTFLRERDIIHIPVTIEMPESIRPIKKRKYDFIFLGNFDHKPNRDAIEFLLKYKERILGDSSLLIGGRNTEVIKKGTKSMKNIHFIEVVEEPSEFLQMGKILIAPILSGGGSRVKIIEAMANGNLIITTPEGAEGLLRNEKEGIIVLKKGELMEGRPVDILKNLRNYTHLIEFNKRNVESFHNIYESLKVREFYFL